MASRQPPFRTSPSTIARYFFHDCERFLWYRSASPQHAKREGIPLPAFDHSPLTTAILQSGFAWEEEVVAQRLAGRVVIAPGSGALHTRRLSAEETIRRLKKEPAGRFLYQPTLVTTPVFYTSYGMDPKWVILSDNHPDLIAILPPEQEGGLRLLRIIDVKRGETLKLTHRVQVLLYALELQAILDAEGITSARVDLDHGAVWLGQHDEPDVFDLSAFRPHLERFLRDDLMRVLTNPAAEAHWHLYHRCEWCEFFDHCREEMRQGDDVSRLERLTPHGKRHLRDEAGVQSLTQLGSFLKRADAEEILDRCASLAGQRQRLQTRVAALQSGEPQLYGTAAPDLPKGENVAVFLTLQQEPLSQGIYLAGLLVTAREDVRQSAFSPEVATQLFVDGKASPCVWLAERPDEVGNVTTRFLTLLADVLTQVHRFNQARPERREQLSLQAYVHTEQERGLLFRCLLDALREPNLAELATTLLFYFQGPELLRADRHPDDEVAYPVVVLQNALGRLLALPIEVSYTLPEMLDALGSTFPYQRKDYFHFPLGHGLRAEALHAAWYRGKSDTLADIRQQARLYLFAVQALLRAVREKAAEHLVTWPPKFRLPSGTGIRDPVLSRLAFLARHESLVACLAIRESRADNRTAQIQMGQVIELQAANEGTMDVLNALPREPEASGFPAWLLVRDSETGRRALVEYADYWYRNNRLGGPANPERAVVAIEEVISAKNPTRLRLGYARPFQGPEPRPGERFLLLPRFTDFTTDRVVRFLESLDGQDGLFLDLLRDPDKAAATLALPKKIATEAAKLAKSQDFTPSQATAFQAICGQRITAVWGPPGTGKTHFLASMIVCLAEAHRRGGRPFRVLVSAFTHAAIENLLKKIVQVSESSASELAIGKAKIWQGSSGLMEVVKEDALADWLEEHPRAVLGATAYSCLKAEALPAFDLVVIDEASQVRVPEAAVGVSLVASEGRLVLAGDHLQLPPIVQGNYPDPPTGEPLLHRSIFEAACGLATTPAKPQAAGHVRQLLENFRMNDVLTSFAARLLYGPDYRCVNATVANQRLRLKLPRNVDPLVKACLDPAYPLVIVTFHGLRTGPINPIEADLVAQLVVTLRDGTGYHDDAAFFRHGVFVVSPHHAQIQAIRRELDARRRWTSPPFVDTVDKMQGQEAEAVIVSYGVADPEFALREAEFIYGLNRLNVAVTRARCKTVLCLPEPLLEATPAVLDVERAAAGLGFMRRLVALVEEVGEVIEFEGDDVEAHVLRAGELLDI